MLLPIPGPLAQGLALASSTPWVWLGHGHCYQDLGTWFWALMAKATCPPTTLHCHRTKQEPGTASHLSPQAPWLRLRSPSSRSGNPQGHGGLGWERGAPSSPDAACLPGCAGVGHHPPPLLPPLLPLPPAWRHPKGVLCNVDRQGQPSIFLGLQLPCLPTWDTGPIPLCSQVPECPLVGPHSSRARMVVTSRHCLQLAQHRWSSLGGEQRELSLARAVEVGRAPISILVCNWCLLGELRVNWVHPVAGCGWLAGHCVYPGLASASAPMATSHMSPGGHPSTTHALATGHPATSDGHHSSCCHQTTIVMDLPCCDWQYSHQH